MYGGIGAAIGTAIALLIGNGLIMNWYYHKKVGIDMKYFWSQILSFIPSLILPIIIGTLMLIFINLYSFILFLLFGSIYVVVFSVSIWFLGMNRYEKDLIGKPMVMILEKLKSNKGE